jgi:hypothetical protein
MMHIRIVHMDFVSPEAIRVSVAPLLQKNFKVEVIEGPREIRASLEWTVPTIVAVYFLKPYFESFLKEAGKDSYETLKGFAKKMLEKYKKGPENQIMGHPSLNPYSDTQSKSYSITVPLQTGQSLKLLFDNQIPVDKCIKCQEDILEMLYDHYSSYPNDKLTIALQGLSTDTMLQLYGIIDPVTLQWDFYDLNRIVERIRTAKLNDKKP